MAKRTTPKPPKAPHAPKATPPKASAKGKLPKRPGPPKAPGAKASKGAAPPKAADDSALKAQIASMKEEIAGLTATVAKAKAKAPNAFSRDQITEGFDVPKGDWRGEYHGFVMAIQPCERGRDGTLALIEGQAPVAGCFLAFPRDNDLGKQGAHARATGRLAVHWEASEDGESYFGQPLYVTPEELALIWAE